MAYYQPQSGPFQSLNPQTYYDTRPGRTHHSRPFATTNVPLNLVGGQIPGSQPHWVDPYAQQNPWATAPDEPEYQPYHYPTLPQQPNPWVQSGPQQPPIVVHTRHHRRHHHQDVPILPQQPQPFIPVPSQPIPSRPQQPPLPPHAIPLPPRRDTFPGDSFRPGAPLGRPTGAEDAYPEMGRIIPYKWAEENEYSPVLDVELALIIKPTMLLNPMLRTQDSELEKEGSVVWDMLYPPPSVLCSADPTSTELWQQRQNELATFPRMNHIIIISRAFPWTINVRANISTSGIKCADVVEAIHKELYAHLLCTDMKGIPEEEYQSMSESYELTRAQPTILPASSLLEGRPGLRRVDWLRKKTVFGGLYTDEDYTQERLGFFSPGVFVVECRERTT